SPTFQPKPPAGPYFAIWVGGASSAVSWQRRHAAPAFRGLARNIMRPFGVSRSPNSGGVTEPLRKALTMSLSQSTALLAGLVGFRVASRYMNCLYSGFTARRFFSTSLAENAETISGRNSYLLCVSSRGAMFLLVYSRTAR